MDRYKEVEFGILEAISNAEGKGMYFADIVKLCPDVVRAHKILKKFVSRNYLTEINDVNGAYFGIREGNLEMKIRKVVCPICKTVRRTYRENQVAIHCSNPECKTPSGRHRTFWLVNIDHLRKGSIKKINCLN